MAAATGTDPSTYTRESPGMSAFALEDDVVDHTYSASPGDSTPSGACTNGFDRAPKGRNETGPWLRRRDEYDQD